MRLSELVRGLGIGGEARADPEVTGVTHDSRSVAPGDLFVAFAGQRFDGRAFAEAAAAKGAVAVVGPEDAGAPEGLAVPWLTTDDPRAVLGPLAVRAYGHPERELILAGVTGTNGKSTVATLLTAILDAAGPPGGLRRHPGLPVSRPRLCRRPHHAGGLGPLPHPAAADARRRRGGGGDGGVLPRPGHGTGGRRRVRYGGLHQPDPRPSGLSQGFRRLLRRQAEAVRSPEAGRAAGGQRRRPLRPAAGRRRCPTPSPSASGARSRSATWR